MVQGCRGAGAQGRRGARAQECRGAGVQGRKGAGAQGCKGARAQGCKGTSPYTSGTPAALPASPGKAESAMVRPVGYKWRYLKWGDLILRATRSRAAWCRLRRLRLPSEAWAALRGE